MNGRHKTTKTPFLYELWKVNTHDREQRENTKEWARPWLSVVGMTLAAARLK